VDSEAHRQAAGEEVEREEGRRKELELTPLMSRHVAQSLLFVLAEVANAWSASEVFVVSVATAIMQISQFAAFIIGDKCDAINVILAQYLDSQLDGDDVCFDVVATLGSECGYLFTGAVLSCLVSWMLLKFGHHAIDERLRRASGIEVGGEDLSSVSKIGRGGGGGGGGGLKGGLFWGLGLERSEGLGAFEDSI